MRRESTTTTDSHTYWANTAIATAIGRGQSVDSRGNHGMFFAYIFYLWQDLARCIPCRLDRYGILFGYKMRSSRWREVSPGVRVGPGVPVPTRYLPLDAPSLF